MKPRKNSNGGAAGMNGLLGLVAPGPLQASPPNWTRDFKKGKRGNWGLTKVA